VVYGLLGSVTLAPQVSTYLRPLLVYLLWTHRNTAEYLHELLLGDTTDECLIEVLIAVRLECALFPEGEVIGGLVGALA